MTDRDYSYMYESAREARVEKLKAQLARLKNSESFTLDEKRIIEAIIRAKHEGIFE